MNNKNILLLMILSLLIAFSVNGIYAMDTGDMEDFSSDLSISNQELIAADLDMGSDGDLAISSCGSVDDLACSDGDLAISSCGSVDDLAICDSVDDDSEGFGSISDSGSDDILSDATISPDLSNFDKGTVSGAVDMVAIHPWGPKDLINGSKGNISYFIPSTATDIKFAYVFVNIYSGSAQSTYGLFADINITTANGDLNNTENLWISSGSADGTVYALNDHVNKCYSDYMITYNITSLVHGLRDSSISVDVHSYPMADKQFDGRIKLISLVLGYDDGDSDEIHYWLNAGQSWTDSLTYTGFDTGSLDLSGFFEANLTNIALSANDGVYFLNNKVLYADEDGGDIYQSGSYYQFHKWDVSDRISNGEDTTVKYIASSDGYASFKNTISLLSIKSLDNLDGDVSFATEYPNTCYAGTNNVLKVNANTNLKGKYTINLLADGLCVDSLNITLNKGLTNFLLTDNTIRAIDASTVYGADNNKVNYTVELIFKDTLLKSYSSIVPVLYNGYLCKDYEYDATGFDSFLNISITGDIVIDIQDQSSYLGDSSSYREDIWNVNLPKYSSFAKAFIYVPYNWFNPNLIDEDAGMFNVTFNGLKIDAVALYRDQGNLGNKGNYGYGLLVYDVTGLIKNGENSFVLNKPADTPAVYPSALVYFYNTSGSGVLRNVYIANGADLLSSSYNLAERVVSANSTIDVALGGINNAKLYIFASGAQSGEGNLIFNGASYQDIWNGTTKTTDLYSLDITDAIKASNHISFVSTGSTIVALQQIIVSSKAVKISTEVTSAALSTTYDSGKAFTIKVLDVNGNPVKGIKLALKIYTGSKYVTKYITTNAQGIAAFAAASTLAIGSHKVEISSSDAKYAVSKASSIKVSKASTVVSAKKLTAKYKKSAYFKVTVKNKATKKAVKGIKVRIKVYTGKKYKTYTVKTNSNGLAKLNTKSLKTGSHKVAISSGDSRYSISKTSKIIIKR